MNLTVSFIYISWSKQDSLKTRVHNNINHEWNCYPNVNSILFEKQRFDSIVFYFFMTTRFLYLYTTIEGEIAVRPFFTTVTNWLQQIPI